MSKVRRLTSLWYFEIWRGRFGARGCQEGIRLVHPMLFTSMVYALAKYGTIVAIVAVVLALLGAVLWAASRLVRPAGTDVNYRRALCAAACMLPLNLVIGYLAKDLLSGWCQVFLQLLVDYLMVLLLIRLPAWRSLFTATAYYSSQAACAFAVSISMSHLRNAIIVP